MNEPEIRLFGIGGAGGRLANAAAASVGGRLPAIAIDTDATDMNALAACTRFVTIGNLRFRGLGSGGDAPDAAMAAEESRTTLATVLDGTALAVVVAGLGEGTGAGALPTFLRLAESRNVPTLAFTVAPFEMEGIERLKAAAAATRTLDGLGTVRVRLSNDELVSPPESASGEIPPETTLADALATAERNAGFALSCIWRLARTPAFLRLSPATLVQTVLAGRGDAHFAIAEASGPDRENKVADILVERPTLGLRAIAGDVRGALVGICAGRDLRLAEIERVSKAVSGMLPTGTPVRLSVATDSALEGRLLVSTLAFRNWNETAGVPDSMRANNRFSGTEVVPVDGENLDEPTWIRRNLKLAMA